MAESAIRRVALQGDITVSYRREKGAWYATALEFDIIGHGESRAAALKMLRELLEEYLREIAEALARRKRVKFYNPSDAAAWNRTKQFECFHVKFVLHTSERIRRTIKPGNLGRLVEYIDSLDDIGVEFVPALGN